MPISHDQCAPYLSTTLLKINGNRAPSVKTLRKAVVTQLERGSKQGNAPSARREIHKVNSEVFKRGDLRVAWVHYSEKRPPPWYIGDDLDEVRHHIVILARKGDIVALTLSDPAFRATLVAEVQRSSQSPLNSLSLLTPKQMNDAFVGEKVRTLWLSGAHRRISTKADSKILSGIDLGAALNPLEDQSYYFSSIRSTPDIAAPAGKGGGDVVVGTNPRNARVWLGPSKDWNAFIDRIGVLIDAAARATAKPLAKGSSPPVLAQPMEGVANASAAYDMAINLPEAISPGNEGNDNDPWLHEFSDAARFEVTADTGSPSFEAQIFWGSDSYGRIKYDFSASHGAKPSVKTTVLEWETDAEHQKHIRQFCIRTDLLTVYYDTGHTFSRGLFYETKFRDARFSDWCWAPLNGFRVCIEKPLDGRKLLISKIGELTDDSLFGCIVRHWPNLPSRGTPTGWLVCDDGAMESADFIHFNDKLRPPELTLVHAKGSGSDKANRGLSVSNFEIVVSQAVKNLRYLDRSHIHEKLTENSKNKIGSAVWYDGKRQQNRDGVLKALKSAGSNIKTKVCVFQPGARSTEEAKVGALLAAGKKNQKTQRLQQLDALLLAARAECLGLGADFQVIGEDDKVSKV